VVVQPPTRLFVCECGQQHCPEAQAAFGEENEDGQDDTQPHVCDGRQTHIDVSSWPTAKPPMQIIKAEREAQKEEAKVAAQAAAAAAATAMQH